MISQRRENTLTVGELTRYVKMLMDKDALLSAVSVQGEISNLKYHSSGHLYFTLKDGEAEIGAVMFRSAAANLKIAARDGMQVIAFGRVSVYVSAMLDNGVGALQLEYERLKKQLTEEGLFDKERKRAIPRFPTCIGIITSPTGAAVRDMINVTGRRWPSAKILLYPSLVQGEQAPESLCRGLDILNATEECDVIIIGRGGGSIEDLWAFNDERVVRRVASSETPVISAVGHETDFTLCDFAADLRAPTPSAAAELAVPDRDEMRIRLDEVFGKTEGSLERCLRSKKERLLNVYNRIELSSPMGRLALEKKEFERLRAELDQSLEKTMQKRRERLSLASARIAAINPLAVLGRGYSYAQKGGAVIYSAEQLSLGDKIDIRFFEGSASAEIISLNEKK